MTVAVFAVGCIVLAGASVIDVAEHRIPNPLTHSLLVVCALASMVGPVLGHRAAVVAAISGAAVFGLLLYLPHRRRPGAMGMGDVKLAITLGFVIGWVRGDVGAAVVAVGWTLALASVLGLTIGAAAAALRGRRLGRDDAVAFGPALSAAGLVAVGLSVF